MAIVNAAIRGSYKPITKAIKKTRPLSRVLKDEKDTLGQGVSRIV
ncbi:hypothetical protein [Paraburkholderia sp. RL17-381-BIF-C]